MRPALAFLCLALVAIVPGARAETLTLETRKQLLEKADDWLVPQPAPDARLIKVWVFQSDAKDFYALGFVEPDKPNQALVGFDYWELTDRLDTKDVDKPSELALGDIASSSPFEGANGINFGLLTGIQLLRRGNEKLGLALINQALGEESGHPHSPFYSPADEAPVLMLARSCLAAALNEITSTKPEFPRIKQRIERLLADQPKLRDKATTSVLKSLDESISHRPAPEGTIERVVDDYLLGGGTHGVNRRVGDFSPAERALISKGFDAVPALLKERHSNRFSNHLMQGFNNFVSYPMSAGQVVDDYLQRLANNEFEAGWLDRQKGYVGDNNSVLNWWKQASSLGEEAYVKCNTVVMINDTDARLSQELLYLARERYPALLPHIYRAILKTSLPSWPVVEALLQSKVPREVLIELLQAGIATNHESHRNTALEHLQDLNPTLADEHLQRLLKNAAATPRYGRKTDQDSGLGRLVGESRNPVVWQALNSLLDRAELGMRMELIQYLYPATDAPPEIDRAFYGIYLRFRDDMMMPLRNLIHEHWGQWLKLGMKPPQEDAPADEWDVYRRAVRLAVEEHYAREGIPAK